MAPEMITRSKYDYALDWWALGVLAFELTVGKAPFNTKNDQECALYTEPEYPKFLSDTAKDFISQLLIKEPGKRLGANGVDEIKEHPFFTGLNWDDVAQKKVTAPFEPEIRFPTDVTHFPKSITKLPPNQPSRVDHRRKTNFIENFDYIDPSIAVTEEETHSRNLEEPPAKRRRMS